MIAFLLGGELGPEGTIDWQSPEWVILLGAFGALCAFILAFPGERRTGALVAELALWAGALVGLVIAVARPVWVEERGRLEPARVAVLIDASASMSVEEGGKARYEDVQAIIDGLGAERVDLYHFGATLGNGVPGAYDLPATDFESALASLDDRLAGEKLAGIALISDGIDRGLLRRRFQTEPDTATLPPLAGPLSVYQVGRQGALKDLSVRSVTVGGYAFLRTPFRLTAEIDGVGHAGESVAATLLRDGAPVLEQRVLLDSEGKGVATFQVTPDRAGRFSYAVSVPVYDGDAVPSNNVAPVVVNVVRDKIRVLQVAGSPSWDVKFLRRFLKGDPSVDLVSFFILRTDRDLNNTNYSEHELSLIQFPYEKLFTSELATFDIVVFQNFDHKPYLRNDSDQLLDNVRSYVVDQGRAFVMTGGDKSFGLGKYGSSKLSDILPFEVSDLGETVDPAKFRPTLTDEGLRHPITRLTSDPTENKQWWDRLSELDGTNVVLAAKPDAAVLLAHPTRKMPNGEAQPVLAVREVGKGRTMALTVDASWRWSLSEAAEGRGNQAFLRFWKNSFRWLMADPTVARVSVDTPRENYAVADTVTVVARARDPGFAPLPNAKVVVTVTGPAGTELREALTNAEGEAIVTLPAERRGAHRVDVVVTEGQGTVGKASTVYAVTTRDPELDEVSPDGAFLKWLAAKAQGQFYGPDQAGPMVVDAEAGRRVFDRKETALWRAPALGLWILALAGLAFVVRRRAGLR